jgi:fucose 4-O-acetylase-like acetyltransferase
MKDRSRRKLTRSQKWIAVLSLVVLALGLGNLARMVMALRYATSLPDLPMTVSWTYLAAMGGFWCVAFLVCAAALIRLWSWARWGTLAAVTLYQVHVWVDHLLFDANERAYQLRLWNLMCTLLLLTFVWIVLSWPSVRKEFEAKA